MESLVGSIVAGTIGRTVGERNLLVEGAALLLGGYWEEVVDDDFVDALNRDTTQYASHVGLQMEKNLPRDVCFGLLVGDRYLDFRSVAEIKGKAKDLLVATNNPFGHITTAVATDIDRFCRLRNYLAHRSQRAERSYARLLTNDYGYQKMVRPGVFLRGTDQATRRSRLSAYIARFRLASESIRNNAAF